MEIEIINGKIDIKGQRERHRLVLVFSSETLGKGHTEFSRQMHVQNCR